jgi:hypothetical protein
LLGGRRIRRARGTWGDSAETHVHMGVGAVNSII